MRAQTRGHFTADSVEGEGRRPELPRKDPRGTHEGSRVIAREVVSGDARAFIERVQDYVREEGGRVIEDRHGCTGPLAEQISGLRR